MSRSPSILTCGFDGSLRQILIQSNKPVGGELYTSSAINDADTLDERPLIVTCHWDATLKLFDLTVRSCQGPNKHTITFRQKQQRKATLRGHSGAVRACAFTLRGRQLVSIDIFADVRVWSVDHGTTVGTFGRYITEFLH